MTHIAENDVLAKIEALVAPQWRSIPNDLPDVTVEAFVAGRNWMIDRIREALDTRVTPPVMTGGDA